MEATTRNVDNKLLTKNGEVEIKVSVRTQAIGNDTDKETAIARVDMLRDYLGLHGLVINKVDDMSFTARFKLEETRQLYPVLSTAYMALFGQEGMGFFARLLRNLEREIEKSETPIG